MRIVAINAVFLLIASCSSACGAKTVHVVVHTPADTPASSSVYLAGSTKSVGNWKADGVRLTRQSDGVYTGNVDLTIGQALEYKITRGSWEMVEKNADGSDRVNHVVSIHAATELIDVSVERWGSTERNDKRPANSVVGNLILHQIDLRSLKQSRIIRVWLPPGYDASSNVRYGVLYMHDGQNCFDRATSAFGNEWQIDETLTKLIGEAVIPPLIVVGIDNGLANRINEYTYRVDDKHGGGNGAAHAEFLLQEVKPFIEKTYRVQTGRAHTFIGGSSLGGLASLEIARRYPDTFCGVIAMSPAISWARESITHDVEENAGGLVGARVWIDMGSHEKTTLSSPGPLADQSQSFLNAMRRFDAVLSKHRIEHRFVIDEQHPEHDEPAWANRFPQAITYVVNGKMKSKQLQSDKRAK
jgi:predicted alpha/beta superfamily hydrolase